MAHQKKINRGRPYLHQGLDAANVESVDLVGCPQINLYLKRG